ncbi:hypothetical protein [Enterocloster sp.]|uniref:hypothetical protein n=1 Tax=Enterocloster sp. TaxID=2719315 RepID=UPI0039947806
MEIRKEIKQVNCYVSKNCPEWIVIHETDNYKMGAGALKHAQAHSNGNLSTSVHWYVDDTSGGADAGLQRRCLRGR